MLAILKRELKNYFKGSSVFLVFTIIYLTLIAALTSNAASWFYSCNLSVGVIVAGVGTRTIANELKNKTYKLLFCSPISMTSIVLGKYFALVLYLLSLVTFLSSIWVVFHLCFGASIIVSELVFGLLGVTFMIMLQAAVAVFMSSWGSNIGIVAVVYLIGIILVIPQCSYYLSTYNELVSALTLYKYIFEYMQPYYKLLTGVINLRTVIYWAASTMGALFLTKRFLESKRFV